MDTTFPVPIPVMPPVDKRQPSDNENPDGYSESLNCWVSRNQEAVEWFLENADEIRRRITLAPPATDGIHRLSHIQERAETARLLIEHVFRQERADLLNKIVFQFWSLDDCRSHPAYQAIKLQWLTFTGEGPSADRLFLAGIAKMCPPHILKTLHPSLRNAKVFTANPDFVRHG